ncbi:eukaryotic translation initiation factor 2A [Aplysia californica]|uniref:Eukaryotic translation initiation factor 2A n=1 Tax=Aplysia californica TaxID=6500 RepID=A0ABM0JLC5_APLCA|nr:eukaryotic translation initiation factor 2A [Aplysia californica]
MASPIYLRGAQGLWTIDGAKFSADATAQIDPSNSCKCMVFSDDGSLFAWCNADSAFILDTRTMEVVHDLGLPKVVAMKFSPKGTVLATWNNYAVTRDNAQGSPNLRLYDVKSGTLKKALMQKKQINWDPEWSTDEKICVRNVNNELQFYENNDFDTIANKLHLQKVSSFGLAQSSSPCAVAAYVPGTKGQPSFVRLYRYPNFAGMQSTLANKSFFKADRVHFYWNKPGQSLIVLTSTESSESSYYGDQGLHFLSTKGESCLVPMQKEGPVYHVEWAPNSQEFVVVHGYMPAKTTIYSLKCEPVFDFGTGPRNVCAFNPQGNILCLAGFGNLAGNLEFWDVKQRRQISKTQAADTTHFEWSPDGQHMLTSTTAPRLRVGNGYRIWHYTGTLMLQTFTTDHAELWQAKWRPSAPPPADFSISSRPVATEVVEQPKAKAAAYRPPHARNQGAATVATKPLQEYEPPSNAKAQGGDKAMSKNRKKKEAKKAKAAQEASNPKSGGESESGSAPAGGAASAPVNVVSTGDLDKDKKIRNLKKKVQQIENLKEQQASGKQLEKNQLEKIKTLDSILSEIEDLELS